MKGKRLAVLMAFLLMATMAYASDFNVTVTNPRDINYLYPSLSTTVVVAWDVNASDDPSDVNFNLWYKVSGTQTRVSIADLNAGTVCASPVLTTTRRCTYTWTIPLNLDNNYIVDVNAFDRASLDGNYLGSGTTFYVDTNACMSEGSFSGNTITLSKVCTGYGTDNNAGTETTSYNSNRNAICGSNFRTYSAPFNLSIGDFLVCHYASDGIGNTETTKTFTATAGASALSILNLAEIIMAALIVITALGFMITRTEFSPTVMLGLVATIIIVVISIILFVSIL